MLSRRSPLSPAALSLVAILVCGVAPPYSALGADGDLDTSFDSDGKVSSDFGNPFTGDSGSDIVIQPDGKIVIGGQTGGFSDLARYHPDGSLDVTFGGDGSSARSGISVAAIALQSDGKIVVAGADTVIGTGVDFAVARFNADGSLDDGSLSDSTPRTLATTKTRAASLFRPMARSCLWAIAAPRIPDQTSISPSRVTIRTARWTTALPPTARRAMCLAPRGK